MTSLLEKTRHFYKTNTTKTAAIVKTTPALTPFATPAPVLDPPPEEVVLEADPLSALASDWNAAKFLAPVSSLLIAKTIPSPQ